SLAVSPDGKIAVSGGNGQKIVAVEIASGQVLWEKNNLAGNVNKIEFPDSETVLAQVDYGAIQRINARTGAMSTAFPEAGDAVWLFDSDQKGEKTVVGGPKAELYDKTGKKIRDFQGIPAGHGDVAISPDGSRVGLGGTDGTLVILDSETGKEIARGNVGRWVGKIKFLTKDIVVTFSSDGLVKRNIEGNQLVSSRVFATGWDFGSIVVDPNNLEILLAMNATRIEAYKTGLKRPAPVVKEPVKEAAPVNTKAVDAAITALVEDPERSRREEETALQAETVLSRRTLEGLDGNEELKKRGKAWLTTGPDPDTGKKTEIRITSPYDQSFLVTPLGVIKLDHPGGTQNKVGFGRILSDGAIVNWDLAAHPRLEFVLYADEEMTVMLDRLVFEGDRGNGSFALLTEQRTEAREWETEPGMQVLLTERANVTLAVESPMAGAILELTGGGFLGKKVLKKGFSTPTLTMDGTKPTGTYEVQLLDRPNGAILQRVGVVWDKEGKKLSASEPLQAFVPKAHVSARGAMSSADPLDSTRGFQAVFGALSEEVAQVMAVDQAIETQQKMAQAGGAAVIASGVLDGAQGDAIKNTQRGNLMALAAQADERFQFSLDPDKLWVKFLEVLQGWREENKAQTMERMRIPEREFYYIRGAEFDGYRKFIDGYNEAVGRMLEAGMNAILTARAGGDAAPHLKQLDGIPAEYGVVMDRLSLLRIKLPDRWVILEAAEAILENSAAELVAQQRAAEARVQGEEKKFNNPGNAFAGNGGASAPTNRAAEEQASFRHTIDVIMNSEGTGTVSQRIAGYLKAYGGDLVSSVDVIAKAGTVDAGTVGGVEIAGVHEAA
ncbi:MAG: WD40 repeat domain-containing protein, partial [Candidatus Peribacteraceae bacterium]